MFLTDVRADLEIWKECNYEYYQQHKKYPVTSYLEEDYIKKWLKENPDQHMYNSYKECYKFTEEELNDQPVDEYVWAHSSCTLWNKKLNYHKGNLKGVLKLSKSRFDGMCRVCLTKEGFTHKCIISNCSYSFHIECARRAKLHFDCEDGVILSNNIYCPAHTPLLVKKNIDHEEKKTRDLIVKYLKSMKRFL